MTGSFLDDMLVLSKEQRNLYFAVLVIVNICVLVSYFFSPSIIVEKSVLYKQAERNILLRRHVPERHLCNDEENLLCSMKHNTDYPYVRSTGVKLPEKTSSWMECCQACWEDAIAKDENLRCNIWVFCGDKVNCGEDYQTCWTALEVFYHDLKANSSQWVPYTSGIVDLESEEVHTKDENTTDVERKYHTVITASGIAQQWQARVFYYWFQQQKHKCEELSNCEMGGFTRILHSGEADNLMEEIPTFLTDPLPPSYSKRDPQQYVVINRPYAILTWLYQTSIPEKYIFMAEPDYILLHPLPNLMIRDRPALFRFSYILPDAKQTRNLTRKFVGPLALKELLRIPNTGSAPTIMTKTDLKLVAPNWLDISLQIFNDEEANKAWGWVQEMYAFSFALYLSVEKHTDYIRTFMAQPPFDQSLNLTDSDPFYIGHYTYEMDSSLSKSKRKQGWHFNKRDYMNRPPKLAEVIDPAIEIDNDMVRALMSALKEAMENLQCWDYYSETLTIVNSLC